MDFVISLASFASRVIVSHKKAPDVIEGAWEAKWLYRYRPMRVYFTTSSTMIICDSFVFGHFMHPDMEGQRESGENFVDGCDWVTFFLGVRLGYRVGV